MKKGTMITIMIIGIIAIICIMTANIYNKMVKFEEIVNAEWSNVETTYQRRADLIGNLVATVKGYAAHESATLEAVVAARSKATSITVNPDDLTEEKLAQYQRAQGEMGAALGRLLAITENYPDLKANENFLALQEQLEGTENRIQTARRDYNEKAKLFNSTIRRFPNNIVAGIFGFGIKPYFKADEDAQRAPQVEF